MSTAKGTTLAPRRQPRANGPGSLVELDKAFAGRHSGRRSQDADADLARTTRALMQRDAGVERFEVPAEPNGPRWLLVGKYVAIRHGVDELPPEGARLAVGQSFYDRKHTYDFRGSAYRIVKKVSAEPHVHHDEFELQTLKTPGELVHLSRRSTVIPSAPAPAGPAEYEQQRTSARPFPFPTSSRGAPWERSATILGGPPTAGPPRGPSRQR